MEEDNKKIKNWHSINYNEIFHLLKSGNNGLTESEAKLRLKKYGFNELPPPVKESPWKLLIGQFNSLLIYILIAASIISGAIGQTVEAIAIIVIVILAGILGFIQEFKAEKAIDSLKEMAAHNATVLREKEISIVPSRELVPGDVIIVKAGDIVPADGRLFKAVNLQADEAAFTGESNAVQKDSETINVENLTIGDRKNMIFMGTMITYGRGFAIVTETGEKTEFGKIANLLQTTESRRTPLQGNLDKLGQKLGVFSIILATIMSLIGVLRGYEIAHMFVWGVALAVAIIPEALPAVVTITLALGVRRMVKRKALIRKLPAVETLGATNIICSDKTGTLTQDIMTVKKMYTGGKIYETTGLGFRPFGEITLNGTQVDVFDHEDIFLLLRIGILCNDAVLKKTAIEIDEEGAPTTELSVIGDPTEGALLIAAAKAKMFYLDHRTITERLREIPFSSESKRMTTVHRNDSNELVVFAKGAPEVIIDSCSHCQKDGAIIPLTQKDKNDLLNIALSMGNDALRVLAFATKHIDNLNAPEAELENNMIFVGLAGMIDPPRPEVFNAIRTCESAGIKPIMITGDHKVTAIAIAKEIGILKRGKAFTGDELEAMNAAEFEKAVEEAEVFARISPAHKLKIVETLMQKNSAIVAMTGDGVNDSPSLKKADIGVAMGINGTDVSKEAADMILTNDNFASIVYAIEEGRAVFENIKKYLVFLLSGNMGTVFALIFALLMSWPLPLDAVQILFINFIMDGVIAIALGVEPPEKDIMKRKPRPIKEGILNFQALLYIGLIGFWISLVTIGVYYWGLKAEIGIENDVSLFFITLIFARLFNGFACRSLNASVFRINLFENSTLFYSSFIVLSLTYLIFAIPFLRDAFNVEMPVSLHFLVAIISGSTVILFTELLKTGYKKFKKQ